MKNILCLIDQYYPESSANTQCADIIMQKFIKEGFRVDFMSIKQDNSSPTIQENKNSTVFRFELSINRILRKWGKKYNAGSWSELPWLFRKVMGLMFRIRLLFRHKTNSVFLDNVDYKYIEDLISFNQKKYDAIVSFSTPFALHVIARKLKKRGITKKWFPVFLDPFVYNYCFNPKKVNQRKRVAQKVLAEADQMFMARGIMEENIKKGFNPDYHKKVAVIELPNLIDRKIEINPTSKKRKITMAYAGAFYKDIRNPERMLDILSKLPQGMQVILMSKCCEDIIEEKKRLFKKNNLRILGRVEYKKCIKLLYKSDILINLGNTITNQMPSKVLEYISIGKPIINFYFSEQDISLYYFNKYPLVFNINLNKYTESDIQEFVKFCEDNYNKHLSFKKATKNLVSSRSENVVKRIYKEITKDL